MLDLNKFEVYLVGGWVRDRILNRNPQDHDYVVVGATPQDMLDAGFTQVGADFPVFLSPLGDEFALARQERKTGPGYNGFETTFDVNVTLADDLIRRDLTINALARRVLEWKDNGHAKLDDEVIDLHGGQADLEAGKLRHVSDAFGEDPVRILRIARFAARYGFTIAIETFDMIKWMVRDGELDHVTKERVFAEFSKALMEDRPDIFFNVLRAARANKVLWPEIGDDFHMTQHQLSCAAVLLLPFHQRLAVLFLNSRWDATQHVLDNMLASTSQKKFVMKFHMVRDVIEKQPSIMEITTKTEMLMKMFVDIDMARSPKELLSEIAMLLLCVDDTVHLGEVAGIVKAGHVYNSVSFASLAIDHGLKGAEIKDALTNIRYNRVLQSWE